MNATSIVLMGRQPVPGSTKTRLVPALGAAGAAALARAFLADLLERLAGISATRHVLALTGEPPPQPLGVPPPFETVEQGPGDLGDRMALLLDDLGPGVVFVGADCPTLPPRAVRDAFRLLASGYHAVLQPALDGGYTLAGFAEQSTPLLEGIPWGTGEVLGATLAAARRADLGVALLEPGYDVDREEDLALLRYHLAFVAGTAAWPRRSAEILDYLARKTLHERDSHQ